MRGCAQQGETGDRRGDHAGWSALSPQEVCLQGGHGRAPDTQDGVCCAKHTRFIFSWSVAPSDCPAAGPRIFHPSSTERCLYGSSVGTLRRCPGVPAGQGGGTASGCRVRETADGSSPGKNQRSQRSVSDTSTNHTRSGPTPCWRPSTGPARSSGLTGWPDFSLVRPPSGLSTCEVVNHRL